MLFGALFGGMLIAVAAIADIVFVGSGGVVLALVLVVAIAAALAALVTALLRDGA
ncbi:MAG: hypothetical protein ACXVVU_13970 [Solirubrobacteraceae bacterium]